MTRIALILVATLLTVGCATRPRPIPITQADVISMTKAGASDEDIMRRIDATYTVFRLNADDVVRLRNEGVSDRVVTYMLDTYTRAAVSEERRRSSYYYPAFSYHFGYYHHHRRWHCW